MIPILGAGDYTVVRTLSTVVDRRPAYAVEAIYTIRASIQPLSGQELVRAPEGLRSTHGIKIYCGRETLTLRSADVPGEEPDLVLFEGRWYEVHRAQVYRLNSPIPHGRYEAYASETGRLKGSAVVASGALSV